MEKYLVKNNISLELALKSIVKSGSKCLIIVNDHKKILGTLSDGDVRRAILNKKGLNTKINSIYNKNPITILKKNFTNQLAQTIFNKHLIDLLPIIDEKNNITINRFKCSLLFFLNQFIHLIIKIGST